MTKADLPHPAGGVWDAELVRQLVEAAGNPRQRVNASEMSLEEMVRFIRSRETTWTGRPKRAAIYGSVLDAMLTPRRLAALPRIKSTTSPPLGKGIGAARSARGGSSIDGVVCLGRNVISLDRTPVYCVQDGRMGAHNSGSTIAFHDCTQ
jgi:hypothetical protein